MSIYLWEHFLSLTCLVYSLNATCMSELTDKEKYLKKYLNRGCLHILAVDVFCQSLIDNRI